MHSLCFHSMDEWFTHKGDSNEKCMHRLILYIVQLLKRQDPHRRVTELRVCVDKVLVRHHFSEGLFTLIQHCEIVYPPICMTPPEMTLIVCTPTDSPSDVCFHE